MWIISTSSTGSNRTSTDPAKNADAVFDAIRGMFSWYYFASGFWKLNNHFWNPDSSCATVFFIQILAQYVAPFVKSEEILLSITRFAKRIAPAASLGIELGMGGLQVIGTVFGSRTCQRCGALLAMFFHLLVCMMPRPHDIANFALLCGARLIVFASVEGTNKAPLAAKPWLPHFAAISVVVAAVGCSAEFTQQTWACVMYIPIGGFVAYAIAAEEILPAKVQSLSTTVDRPRWVLLASGVAFSYSFLGIITGLQEESTPNMFANLKTHGGIDSHWLFPTGLLFHAFGDYPDSHPFGGGEVRIEETTSLWLKTVYPNDLSALLEPRMSIHLFESIGHHAPYIFNPGLARVLGITPPQAQFYQYTVPALELKRLLREAKKRDEDFDLTYAQLPGTKGDEVWRSTATKRRFYVKVHGGQVTECNYVTEATRTSTLCGSDDLPMLPDDSVPFILQRISMYLAYPIVPTTSGEIPPTIRCFGP
jgi:hypothetical protein